MKLIRESILAGRSIVTDEGATSRPARQELISVSESLNSGKLDTPTNSVSSQPSLFAISRIQKGVMPQPMSSTRFGAGDGFEEVEAKAGEPLSGLWMRAEVMRASLQA